MSDEAPIPSALPDGLVRMIALLPPFWLIRFAVAAVWLYEGLWCKLLGGEPHQLPSSRRRPASIRAPARSSSSFSAQWKSLLALWALSAVAPIPCAAVQTLLLVSLNAGGLIWARRIIHDPAGMVVKNFAFLVLVWVSASLPGWR